MQCYYIICEIVQNLFFLFFIVCIFFVEIIYVSIFVQNYIIHISNLNTKFNNLSTINW